MGFMNLFKNVKRAADAKAQNAADAIEEKNMVDFGKQDLAQMEADLRTIKGNIGSIKGEIAVLNDKVNDIKAKIAKHDADALALSEAGQPDLAEQHAGMAASLEEQAASLSQALESQRDVLKDQIKSKNELSLAYDQAKADLVTIKAMTDAASANNKLTQVSTASGTSALASFQARKDAAKKQLIKSQALKEDNSADSSLEAATTAALGNSAAKSRLAKLAEAAKAKA